MKLKWFNLKKGPKKQKSTHVNLWNHELEINPVESKP